MAATAASPRAATAAAAADFRKPRANPTTHGGGLMALTMADLRISWTRGVPGERDALRAEDHKRKSKNQHHGYPNRDDHDPDPRRRQARTGRSTRVRHEDTSTNTPTPNSTMMAIAPPSAEHQLARHIVKWIAPPNEPVEQVQGEPKDPTRGTDHHGRPPETTTSTMTAAIQMMITKTDPAQPSVSCSPWPPST